MVADHEFKVNSPAQKLDLIYGVRRCRPRNARGRPLGKDSKLKPSAGALALKQAKLEHPIVNHIIRAMEDVMESDKQMSNVTGRLDTEGRVEGGIRFYTDRFRTAYGAAGRTSTRLSSKSSDFWDGTNAQNIRETFRDFLVADPECILLDVDFSQSDDVFVGYESNDAHKIEVIESGMDGHAIHGELFFARPYDWIVAGKKAGDPDVVHPTRGVRRSEEHTSELQSLMRISYAVFCLKKKKK